MPWRNPLRGAWSGLAGGGRRLAEAGRAFGVLGPPGSPVVPAVLRLLLLAWVVAGAVALFWTARHALSVRRLTRGVGDTVFYSADGKPWFPLDEHRRDVALKEISPHLRAAVVAVEDHRFYRHPGIDALGIARAAQRNLMRSSVEGGSTLTQQLARTLFLSNDRTYMRKAKEAVLAVMIEQQLSKDQILEMYLNRVYFGAGTYGAEAMSRRLFGKRAKDLSLGEAALLAGLPQAPSALSPWTNLAGARARSRVVLSRMRQEGFIDAARERAAAAGGIRITPSPGAGNSRSGYAKDFLRQQFRERVGNDHPPDWKVYTTFVPAAQQAAEQALVQGLQKVGARGLQGALVALDPGGPVPEVDVVQVHLEDLVLGELPLDLVGHPDLEDLAAERPLASGQRVGEDVAGELHRDGARPFVDAAGLHVADDGAEDALQVDGAMLAEPLVLDGDERLADVLRKCRELDQLALHGGEVRELGPVAIEEDGGAAGDVGAELVHVGTALEEAEVPRHGQHHDHADEGCQHAAAPPQRVSPGHESSVAASPR